MKDTEDEIIPLKNINMKSLNDTITELEDEIIKNKEAANIFIEKINDKRTKSMKKN